MTVLTGRAGASAQGGRGGRPPPPKKIGTGGRPPSPQTKKHRKAQKNDESALRAKEVIYYQCVTGVTRPPQSKFGADAPAGHDSLVIMTCISCGIVLPARP